MIQYPVEKINDNREVKPNQVNVKGEDMTDEFDGFVLDDDVVYEGLFENQGDLNDILEYAPQEIVKPELVKLEKHETALSLFVRAFSNEKLHWAEETDFRGYYHCNGEDCIACKAGRKADERLVLPVYLPMDEQVGYLLLSKSQKPKDLLPKLRLYFNKPSYKDIVLFVSRDRYAYSVSAKDLPKDADRGEGVIQRFIEGRKKGLYDPSEYFERFTNDDMLLLPTVSHMAKLKGLV